MIKMDLNELVLKAHNTAKEKGWHESDRPITEAICLVHAELSEAVEEIRANRKPDEIYYEGQKPCGFPVEIADTIIRLADICGKYNLDLNAIVEEKMKYNETRPYKHGKVL